MSLKGVWTLTVVCLLMGTFVIIADNSLACFSWEVNVEDWDNHVDGGKYTQYEIDTSFRPGCRSTYWVSFRREGEPPGWESNIIDMKGNVIDWGGEFVLSGTVNYVFTYKVVPDPAATPDENPYITVYIRANDKYNQDEEIDQTFHTTVNGLNRGPDSVTLYLDENLSNSIKLSWDQSDYIYFDRYEIHMSNTMDFTPVEGTLIHSIYSVDETEYNITGLSEGSTYYIILRVCDSGDNPSQGRGGPYFADSNMLDVDTPGINYPPTAVVLDPPTDIANRSARLTWSQNSDADFDCYEIHVSDTPGFTPNQATRFVDPITDQNTVTYVVEGLDENRTSFFVLRVWDYGGVCSDSNEVNCTTLDNWPNPVDLYDPWGTTAYSTNLNWSQNCDTDFDRYEVHMSETGGFTPSEETWVANITSTTENYAYIDDLAEKATYYFCIMVYDQAGHYSVSNEKSVTTLDITAPTIIQNVPADDAIDVEIDDDIVITFDEAMDTASLNFSCSPNPGNWDEIWNVAADEVTITHDDFDDNTEHTFTITEAWDISGNPIASTFQFSFTTRDLTPPEITSTNPVDDATDVLVTTDISFTFSEPMDQDSVNGSISTTINYGGTPQWSGNTMTLVPTADLSYFKSYTVTIGTGATDASGNALASSFPLNFKTEEADINHAPQISVQSPSSDIADDTFTIEWSASDSDGDSISINLYYDTDKNTNNGMTLIQSSLSNSGSYIWDTSSLAEGNYFVYSMASDGELEAGAYSGLLTIDHEDVTETDTDGDGIPDATDTDDDNDGIPDSLEDLDGDGELDSDETDPLEPDTDGDGYNDDVDEFPRDPVRWVSEPSDEDDESALPLVLVMIVIIAIIVAFAIAAWAITSGKKGGVPPGTISCPTCGQPFAPDPTRLPYVQCPHCGTSGRMQ